LHKESICHRDIKGCNLVIEEDGKGDVVLKLIDFGVSKRVKGGSAELLSPAGTEGYRAPEMNASGGYGMSVDIWSAGVVLG
jgi:serine/threonine protein kinase